MSNHQSLLRLQPPKVRSVALRARVRTEPGYFKTRWRPWGPFYSVGRGAAASARLWYVRTFPWAPEAWREVRQHIPWLLAEQARLRKTGWFN
jgi:hypothetical protein